MARLDAARRSPACLRLYVDDHLTMILLKIAACLLCLLFGAWGALALHFQAPPPARLALLGGWLALSAAAALLLWWLPLRTALIYALAVAALLVWWLQLAPSNRRDWADDVALQATGHIDGSRVRLDHVRNFRWRTPGDYDIRWETREYDLDQLQSLDMILSYWGRPAIAHVLVSFGFSDGEQLVFSVEIRRERHEQFSELGGFFKQFEASVIAADERDIVYLRTNVRGEDDYLYRIHMPAAARRSLFLAYVEEANRLARRPRYYNTITANCTTLVYKMVARIIDGLPMDYRLIFSGLLPAYIHTLGGLAPGHTLAELRERGRITQRALDTGSAADFSQAIRRGVPGIVADEGLLSRQAPL